MLNGRRPHSKYRRDIRSPSRGLFRDWLWKPIVKPMDHFTALPESGYNQQTFIPTIYRPKIEKKSI